MPRNGSGSYSLPSGNPFIPSTVISSTTMNNTMSDIATGLTQSIANDGQTTPVANLPMATFRHTNVGNAVNRTDYAAAGQVQDSSLQWLTSVAGTDTITASITPSPAAYAAGQTFRFVSAGANTTSATLNINGLGAKNITKRGTGALAAGDIASGQVVEVVYDGTQFQMASIAPGVLLNVQVFTANGTYTPTVGMRTCIAHVQGGGGGGGGTATTGVSQFAIGGAGSSGSYGVARLTAATIGASQAITIGAAGAFGGTNGNGGAGGISSIGAIMSSPGGIGGGVGTAQTAPFFQLPATSPAIATGGNILNTSGIPGQAGMAMNALQMAGVGGGSPIAGGSGGGPLVSVNSAGQAAIARGAGGSGGALGASQAATTGGAGGAGLIVIYEYS